MYLATLILLAIVIFTYLVGTRMIVLRILVGSYYIDHWLSWIGTFYIAIVTPLLYYLKKRYPARREPLLKVHTIGNLLAVMLISAHLIQQLTRPPQFYPDLGTGIILYVAALLLVASGYSMRYLKPTRYWKTLKFIHNGSTMTFYLTIGLHILHGLGYI